MPSVRVQLGGLLQATFVSVQHTLHNASGPGSGLTRDMSKLRPCTPVFANDGPGVNQNHPGIEIAVVSVYATDGLASFSE